MAERRETVTRFSEQTSNRRTPRQQRHGNLDLPGDRGPPGMFCPGSDVSVKADLLAALKFESPDRDRDQFAKTSYPGLELEDRIVAQCGNVLRFRISGDSSLVAAFDDLSC